MKNLIFVFTLLLSPISWASTIHIKCDVPGPLFVLDSDRPLSSTVTFRDSGEIRVLGATSYLDGSIVLFVGDGRRANSYYFKKEVTDAKKGSVVEVLHLSEITARNLGTIENPRLHFNMFGDWISCLVKDRI